MKTALKLNNRLSESTAVFFVFASNSHDGGLFHE